LLDKRKRTKKKKYSKKKLGDAALKSRSLYHEKGKKTNRERG